MKLSNYIKSKIFVLSIFALGLLTVVLLLRALKMSVSAIVVVCTVIFLSFIIGMIWDYLTRRRFYAALFAAVKLGKNANYITEYLERPHFLEGRLTYDALASATKDMNDRIADHRIASDEYRDYIETWIHEVKTPIAASRLVLGNSLDSSDVLRSLSGEMDRIESHVEQALYYARSTAVEKDFSIKMVQLDAIVKASVKKYSRSLIDAGIMPRFEGLDVFVYTDPKWLDFIIGQIISNAIKYHRPQTDDFAPEIAFVAERMVQGYETDKVCLHISDNGIGIHAADLGRVFDKGFTGENGRSFAKSTGIGLYLCKIMCEKMKLKLSIASTALAESDNEQQPAGTTLRIDFTLNKMYFLDN